MTLESMSGAGAPIDRSRIHPSIALAPYVEALVVGRRVAVIGDASLGLAEALVSRGARLVHAYDPDPVRVAEAIARKAPPFGSPGAGRPVRGGVAYALLGDDLGVRDGAFDAVLIPDLTLFADRTDVVRRAKRLVAPAGAVIVASPNPDAKQRLVGTARGSEDAPGYYEIFDLLSLQFRVVRMVGQAPFVGYAIVDFAADREPDVSFDASLMAGTEEPERFVAIASDRAVALDPYVVVEVPAAQVLAAMGASADVEARGPSSARDVHRSPSDHVQIAEMQTRVVLMEAELDDLRSQKGELARQLDAARIEIASAAARSREAASESAARAEAMSVERVREIEARAGDEHVRAERLTHKVRDLEEELVHQRDRAQKLTKQLDDEKRARQKAEIELGMQRGLPKPEGEGDAARMEELSAALRHAKGHADSLASELLAKSKETAELRREHEAAEEKIADLGREREAAVARIAELTRERDAAAARLAELTRERDAAAARLAEVARERDAEHARAVELQRERDAAMADLAEASRSLHDAQAKLDDMEQGAQTLRRPQPIREPVVVAADMDANMMARITRLEATATTERRAAEDARREAEDQRRLMAESQRAIAETQRALDAAVTQRDAAFAQLAKLEKDLEEERGERKDLVIAKAALEADAIALKQRIDALSAELEAAPEVTELEAALRDRGHKIAGLERDLRESERIGRELIAEVEALRAEIAPGGGDGGGGGGGAMNGQGGARGGSSRGAEGAHAKAEAAPSRGVDALSTQAFQHRIDALAADAAKKQAELLSSTWRIQALERELTEARTQVGSPTRAENELSGALVRAQSEIADLRRALSLRGGDVPRSAVEDAVLLHQQMAR